VGHASAPMTLDVCAGFFRDDMEAVAEWLDAVPSLACADWLRTAEALRLAPRAEARAHMPSELRKPMVGLGGFEPTTCGFHMPDSTRTRHPLRDSSGRPEADCKPLTSTNTAAKTSGGPRRARTDDLRIKRATEPRWKGS
jgi:hypothetical protein